MDRAHTRGTDRIGTPDPCIDGCCPIVIADQKCSGRRCTASEAGLAASPICQLVITPTDGTQASAGTNQARTTSGVVRKIARLPAVLLIDPPPDDGVGRLDLVVTSRRVDSTTSSVDTVTDRSLDVGEQVEEVSVSAVFEILVEQGESFTLSAETDASDSFLTAQVFDLAGYAVTAPAVFQTLPSLGEPDDEVIDLFRRTSEISSWMDSRKR